MNQCELSVSGKWILAGEHTVLRGGEALVFPLHSKKLKLKYEDDHQPQSLEIAGAYGKEISLIFWGVIEKLFSLMGERKFSHTGKFSIENEIPVGAGLGASAALCVAVVNWAEKMDFLKLNDVNSKIELARKLENLFHGESSGVDVAACMLNKPIIFKRGEEPIALDIKWQPNWFLSYSGRRSVTLDCVNKVKKFINNFPEESLEIDRKMQNAVKTCRHALVELDKQQGLSLLIEGLQTARSCFDKWDLVQDEMREHLNNFERKGAIVTKPTGSGGGGYALSVWDDKFSPELNMIKV